MIVLSGYMPEVAFAGTEVSASTEEELRQAILNAGTNAVVIRVTDDIEFSEIAVLETIDIPSGADVTIKASGKDISLIKDADSSDYAIFNVESGGSLTLSSDGDNTLTVDGRQIASAASSITVSGSLKTNNVDFTGNYIKDVNSLSGGAISVSGGSSSCTVNGGKFSGNKGGMSGGAISAQNSTLTIDGAEFSQNTVANKIGNGGAVYGRQSKIDFKDSTFSENSAMVGGAVELYQACTGTIENCTFKKNTAAGDMGKGGALDLSECYDVSILSGTFENNKASSWGGAIYTDGAKSDFFMNRVLFENNSASIHGGAIWHCPLGTAHYYTYSGMLFWNNTAKDAGADMYLAEAKPGSENGGEYVSGRSYAGDDLDWCLDSESGRYDADAPEHITESSYYQGSNASIAMKSNISESEYLATKDAAKIVFSGNTAAEGGAVANNGFVEAGYKSGLIVEKQVTGDGAPADDEFTFKITFSDGKSYDGVESGGTFSLRSGGKKVISDIPEGVKVSVTEQDKKNYMTEQSSQTATIGEYGTELLFVNKYTAPQTGGLKVSKTVSGDGADSSQEFGFKVALDDSSINGTYKDLSFTDGTASFTLKAGESKTAAGLPAGTGYTVEESGSSGYTVTVNGGSQTSAKGTIKAGETAEAAFNNYRSGGTVTEPASAVIKAAKTLDGAAPQGSDYSFVLKDEGGKTLQTVKNSGGSVSFGALSFSRAGIYRYTLSETAGTDSRISYDSSVYTAIVTVTGSDTCHAEIAYEKDGKACTGIPVFANTTKGSAAGKTTVSVRKVWKDGGSAERPSSVSVQLYRDGKAFGDAVKLTAAGGWKTEWKDLDSTAKWTVDEVSKPDGYTKLVYKDGSSWTITNKLDAADDTETETASPQNGHKDGSTPKTGDSAEPVLWLALALCSGTAAAALFRGRYRKR